MLCNIQGNTAYIWRQLILFNCMYLCLVSLHHREITPIIQTGFAAGVPCKSPSHPNNSRAKKMCLSSFSACLTNTHCSLPWGHGQGGSSNGERKGSSDPHNDTWPPTSDCHCARESSQAPFVTPGLGVGKELTPLWVIYCWEQVRSCAFWRKGAHFFRLKLLKFIVHESQVQP